ncbi:MAG: hypothetical protein U9O18_04325 [Chloroflexota bacterium]|nr:hypothetical protein [Chloroflexota bacterium]
MFRLIRFTFKAVVTLKLMAFAFSAGMGAAYVMQLRAQYRSWGLVDDDRAVAGDELVPEADIMETRTIDIDVAPDQVWPWLVQLGYGRGGWYSYPLLDRSWSPSGGSTSNSADSILEEFQDLAEGDLVPTQQGSGFVVRVLEPSEALVLYLDDIITREHIEEMVADASEDAEEAVEAIEDMDMPPYKVSWAFVLEDAPGGRTRLVERLRIGFESLSGGQRRATPVLSMGVFALMRSQLLGIKSRAEAAALDEG